MKHLFKFLFFSILLVVISNCARTGRPEGGPKDEDAPLFVTSNPPYETINFDKKEIELQFNEYVKLTSIFTATLLLRDEFNKTHKHYKIM